MKETFLPLEDYKLQALLYTPNEAIENPPLIIYLHGAGERGENINNVKRFSIPKMIANGFEIPAVVLCPQCPRQYVWNNIVVLLKELIDKVVLENNVCKNKITITGGSMGGFGTWEMGLTYKNFFAGIAPIAGGGLSWRCPNLKTTPVYAFHGEIDDAVPLVYSQLMVDSTNAKGGNAKLTVLKGFGHNDGIEYAYEKCDVINWLLNQYRNNFEYVPETLEHLF